MKHALSLSLAAAALMAFLPALPEATNEIGISSPCAGNAIKMEPVVNVDVTGSTLLGPTHFRFTAYNSGLVTVSRASLIGVANESAGSFPFADADTIFVSTEAVDQLAKNLRAAGAFSLCDQNFSTADVPLTTVTVFRGATNAVAHTYSYWAAFGEHADAALAIGDFIQEHLSGF